MAGQHGNPSLEALRKLEESLAGHFCEQEPPASDEVRRPRAFPLSWWGRLWPAHRVDLEMSLLLWWPRLRKLALVSGGLGGLAALAVGALWWRLSSGPIELDVATPWLTVAIKENLGGGHEVEIGGTQIERDANGRTSLRIRDIVVRDSDGSDRCQCSEGGGRHLRHRAFHRPYSGGTTKSCRRGDGGSDRIG